MKKIGLAATAMATLSFAVSALAKTPMASARAVHLVNHGGLPGLQVTHPRERDARTLEEAFAR
jgi:hypothetical protein